MPEEIVLLLSPATALSVPPDRHTLSGVDAVVAGEWLAAVPAFEASLSKTADDEFPAGATGGFTPGITVEQE